MKSKSALHPCNEAGARLDVSPSQLGDISVDAEDVAPPNVPILDTDWDDIAPESNAENRWYEP
jgi:hypothetical protein